MTRARLEQGLLTGLLGFLTLAAGMLMPAAAPAADAPASAASILAVSATETEDGHQLVIASSDAPTFTVFQLFDPLRIVVDIAQADATKAAGLPLADGPGPIARVDGRLLADKGPPLTRLEVGLREDVPYIVERQGHDIVIAFPASPSPAATGSSEAMAATPTAAAAPATEPVAATASSSLLVDTIQVEETPGQTRVLIRASGPITATRPVELAPDGRRPHRMYLDLPGWHGPGVPAVLGVGTGSLKEIRSANRDQGLRVVFDSNQDRLFRYQVETQPDGLLVLVEEPGGAQAIVKSLAKAPPVLAAAAADSSPAAEPIQPVISTAAAKPRPEKTPAGTPPAAAASRPAAAPAPTTSAPAGQMAFAGYEKTRITVDFYKIDLHNVFRLFGEISGMNIVVDEAVAGSLTLALRDVPWDFALDIVLNLKDLQKEERFNTLVISPKTKTFVWPKQAEAALAIRPDGTVQTREAISVQRRQETPPAQIEAQKLMLQAQGLERQEKYEEALPVYEQALELWPDNAQLANRLAALCLVRLGLNAKAVHFARMTLKSEPDNQDAALNAAIGLANMKEVAAAKPLFDKAVAGPRPAAEALISYAAFCEENDSLEGALRLLARHEDLYGNTLDTLVARARIHDKAGQQAQAAQQYRALLLSGFELPPDLRRYIEGRLTLQERDAGLSTR
ncbi:MAG: AMIN domain-containing protein [Thermodesulfobacteriota bacterium]